jgi:hypothetical protein
MSDSAVPMRTNGAVAAAVLSAAIGCFALGTLAFAGDAVSGIAHALNVWNPTGPLSGVTDAAIAIWLMTWFLLSVRWVRREVNMGYVNITSALLFAGGLLLTFPPFMDLLQGK